MDKQSLIQLTNQLYKLTLLFPKKEPLRYKMRESALEILGLDQGSSRQLETLDCLFEVAKVQNWVKAEELLSLQMEYSKLREELKNERTEERKNLRTEELKNERTSHSSPAPGEQSAGKQEVKTTAGQTEQPCVFSVRQQAIIKFLEQNQKAQVVDIQKILPDVTKRTLRRDFRDLLRQDVVERVGERQETYYQLSSKLKVKS